MLQLLCMPNVKKFFTKFELINENLCISDIYF